MRKNWARKLLHGTLDLLPLIIIPIFAINIINRSPEPLTVEYDTTETETVVNYKYQSNVVNTNDDLVDNNIYSFNFVSDLMYNNEYINIYFKIISGSLYASGYSSDDVYLDSAHEYYFYSKDLYYSSFNVDGGYLEISLVSGDYIDLYFDYFSTNDLVIQLISIDDMYIQDDNHYFSYTGYNEIASVETVTTGTVVTYDDTDIGSQFVYSLYHAVDKYFNMGDVFHMQGVYQWFNANIFGGIAPLSIYIVWNIVLYEFIMDLLMLLYSVFMFFIDFCTGLIERCLHKTSGGSL